MKKTIALILCCYLLAGVLALVGCGKKEPETKPEETTAAQETQAEPTTSEEETLSETAQAEEEAPATELGCCVYSTVDETVLDETAQAVLHFLGEFPTFAFYAYNAPEEISLTQGFFTDMDSLIFKRDIPIDRVSDEELKKYPEIEARFVEKVLAISVDDLSAIVEELLGIKPEAVANYEELMEKHTTKENPGRFYFVPFSGPPIYCFESLTVEEGADGTLVATLKGTKGDAFESVITLAKSGDGFRFVSCVPADGQVRDFKYDY